MWVALLALAIALCAGVAHGSGDGDESDPPISPGALRELFSAFDADRNRRVTLHEVLGFASRVDREIAERDVGVLVEQVDVSGDGRVSLGEHLDEIVRRFGGADDADELRHLAAKQASETAKFRIADANGDGVLNRSEAVALFFPETHDGVLEVGVRETMRLKDTDSDGRLTPEEFWEASEPGPDNWELTRTELGDFRRLDIDADGFLNLKELLAWDTGRFELAGAMSHMFELADANRDGRISLNELMSVSGDIAESDAAAYLIQWHDHLEM